MDACMESGEVLQRGEVLRLLFNCRNAQGGPPLHMILTSKVETPMTDNDPMTDK